MIKLKTKRSEVFTFRVEVLKRDIEGGKCGVTSRCMHRVAIERALRKLDPGGGDHKVRVDAQLVKFNLNDFHWQGLMPKVAKMNLIIFDKERKARDKAERDGVPFVSKVTAHCYKMEAERGTKVKPFTRERQDQVNEARRRRVAAGKPDKQKYDLRYRVEGLGSV